MQVNNITKSTIITENVKIATSLLDKTVGLLSKKNPRSLLFYTRFGIHTFGLGKPIDILILSNKYQVTVIKENLAPNNFFFWNPKDNRVLELPQGTIKKSKTQIGNLVKII